MDVDIEKGGETMSIYGHKFDKFIKTESDIIIEMTVDKETIDFLLQEQKLLHETLQADLSLQSGKTKVDIRLRDKVTVTRNKHSSHEMSTSFKIMGPKKIVDKTGNIDVILPGYKEDAKPEDLKPYIDKVIEDKFKKGYPDSVKLALDFAEKEQKLIRLIYQNPNTENQKKLLKQLIKDSNYIIDFTYTIDNENEEGKIKKDTQKILDSRKEKLS